MNPETSVCCGNQNYTKIKIIAGTKRYIGVTGFLS
jgi:hypothetical protein